MRRPHSKRRIGYLLTFELISASALASEITVYSLYFHAFYEPVYCDSSLGNNVKFSPHAIMHKC